jgi:hypothetical protein
MLKSIDHMKERTMFQEVLLGEEHSRTKRITRKNKITRRK